MYRRVLLALAILVTSFSSVFAGEPLFDRQFLTDTDRKGLSTKLFDLQKKENSVVADAQRNLDVARKNVLSISGQLRNLNEESVIVEQRSAQLEREIDMLGITIRLLEDEVFKAEIEVDEHRDLLDVIVRLLFERTQFGDFELLFMANSLADSLNYGEYVEILESELERVYSSMKANAKKINFNRLALRQKKERLISVKSDLDELKVALATQRKAKQRLLERTRMTEDQFDEELRRARQRHVAVDSEVRKLRYDLQEMAAKQGVDPVDFGKSSAGFVWPVAPTQGLSAEFMDVQYQQVFGIPHYAIDIVTAHGTSVASALDGVVLTVKDAGYGYSYIVVGHKDKVSTVYGHMSGFAVSEGDVVRQGDVIGWSGGTPGTRGSGWMTTGAHLHFEVRVDGVPKDPLKYL